MKWSEPSGASSATTDADMIETAEVAPTIIWRERPNTA